MFQAEAPGLSNHLGNVLTTISDRKTPDNSTIGDAVTFYKPIIIRANDYYPFGMLMPGRNFSSTSNKYRYGFNGQERSTEINTDGNSMTAEFWQYDARLGRRWNIDPKPGSSISTYSVFKNSPLFITDVKGDTTYQFNESGNFMGVTDLDKKGIRGSVGHYESNDKITYKKIKGKQVKIIEQILTWKETSSFTFNDPINDSRKLLNIKEGDVGLIFISNEEIKGFMVVAGVKPRWVTGRLLFAIEESKQGLIDFSYSFLHPAVGTNPKEKYGVGEKNQYL